MAKKYLLYIHHTKFVDEPKKSELVNNLLNDWYDSGVKNPRPQNSRPAHNLIIKTKAGAEKVAEELCIGHDSMRFNCGRKGCRF